MRNEKKAGTVPLLAAKLISRRVAEVLRKAERKREAKQERKQAGGYLYIIIWRIYYNTVSVILILNQKVRY